MSEVIVKEYVIKDEPAFRLKVRQWKALNPKDLNSVEFVQECMRDGEVDFSSTYNFLMTDRELLDLANSLVEIVRLQTDAS